MLILKILILILAGTLTFSLIKPKEFCSTSSTAETIRTIFLESKNMALEYGESYLEFSQGEAKIVAGNLTRRVYKLPARVEAPSVSKKACTNTPGIPTVKTTFKFSPKGLKDISGTLYLRCGDRFLAFSVLSPTGGITYCIFKGNSWEVIN